VPCLLLCRYPQFTEAKILSEFIKTDAHRMAVQARPPMAVTNAVSWRQEGLFYKKNEVFLDVVESVNLLVNSNGTVVRSEVVGALKMRAYLSGMVSSSALVWGGRRQHPRRWLVLGCRVEWCAWQLNLILAHHCLVVSHPLLQPECKCGVNDKVRSGAACVRQILRCAALCCAVLSSCKSCMPITGTYRM
jgi:hypothetical protein